MMDRLLENNTVLKILSVIVAIFIWIQATSNQATSTNRTMAPVPVSYPSINPHLTVMSVTPTSVSVEIKGQPSAVGAVSLSQVQAFVNLSQLKGPGTRSIKVSVAVPANVGVYRVTPARVDVTVAKIVQQKLPVTLKVAGLPAAGSEMSGYTGSLKQATISGPTGALKEVTSVTGTVNLGNRSHSFTADVVLHALNAVGKVVPRVQVNPPSDGVDVTIKPKPPQKVLPVITQLTGQVASGYKISQIAVYPSSVTLSGSVKALAGLRRIDTIPINVTGASKSITEAVPVVLPKGTSLVNSGEVQVTITIVSTS